MQATKLRRRPPATSPAAGRAAPAGGGRAPSAARERLIETAEALFAQLGYEACTFRAIAAKSGINQGLLHYYFTSKQNLFSEVFMRRAQVIADRRAALLDAALDRYSPRAVPLEVLVRSFLAPALEMATQGEGGRAFVRIHSQLRGQAGDLGLALRRQAFGPTTERYVQALCAACPHLPPEAVYWRFNFMIGSYLVVSSQAGRLQDYSGGRCDADNLHAALEQLVPFAIAGFLAPPPAAPA